MNSGADTADRTFDCLIGAFVRTVTGVAHAALVSADGILMAASAKLPPERADQLAVITAGLASLGIGAAGIFDAGPVHQTVLEMVNGHMLVMGVGNGSHLVALASRQCDLGQAGYEMAVLVERVGRKIDASPREAR